MQIHRKIFGTLSAVRMFVGNVRLTSVALGSSSDNIRSSDNLRELLHHFEWSKKQTLKNSGGIPAGFRIFQLTMRNSQKHSYGESYNLCGMCGVDFPVVPKRHAEKACKKRVFFCNNHQGFHSVYYFVFLWKEVLVVIFCPMYFTENAEITSARH